MNELLCSFPVGSSQHQVFPKHVFFWQIFSDTFDVLNETFSMKNPKTHILLRFDVSKYDSEHQISQMAPTTITNCL